MGLRGTSQSQTAPSSVTTAPRGSAASTAGMRRRRSTGGGGGVGVGSGGSSSGGSNSNMLRFYSDDAAGMKMSPTVVLVISLCFIGFVASLHVFGKLYLHRSGPSPSA